jgi:hypothetical protein
MVVIASHRAQGKLAGVAQSATAEEPILLIKPRVVKETRHFLLRHMQPEV